ncbi:hypothetical protein ACFQ34_15220 [Pseudonocardia benzenivorans]|uniref:Small secreted protein n=2 Tax=Pseudonocardia TaxID=1847 RepID=F4CIS3_PSEUX|nr:hypothetical protein [Pseudonocardia dioxanivorans]AEA22668.1 hypothetical protein Psed_0396 [Pseudonocardia dioxanivorans CB1190]
MRRTPRSLRVAAVAVAAALATVVGGCSSGPSDADVAWADGLCSSILTFTDAVKTQPNIDSSNPDKAIQGLSDYLGTASTAVQGSIDSMGKLGPSPIDGGDAVVTQLKSTLTSVKSSFDQARQQLQNVDTNDPSALTGALTDALSPLQQLSKLDTSGLNGNADINAAAAKAANCQKLQQTG